jgi:hypothetical protein
MKLLRKYLPILDWGAKYDGRTFDALRAASVLSWIHAVGQASRLSLTLNDRLEALFSTLAGSHQKVREIFRWRQARRLSYNLFPSARLNSTASFRLGQRAGNDVMGGAA